MNNIDNGNIINKMEEVKQVLEHKYPIFRSFSYLNPYEVYYDDHFGCWNHCDKKYIYKATYKIDTICYLDLVEIVKLKYKCKDNVSLCFGLNFITLYINFKEENEIMLLTSLLNNKDFNEYLSISSQSLSQS